MSVNTNRVKYNKGITSRNYKTLLHDDLFPPYYDEGYHWYYTHKRGFKTPNKQLLMFEVRMYKTWKYNRKIQYKPISKMGNS